MFSMTIKKLFKTPLGLVLAFGLLAGCAATRWSHPRLGEADFVRDRAQCTNEASAQFPAVSAPYNPTLDPSQQAQQSFYTAGANLGRGISQSNYFDNCMMAKGYVRN